MQKRYVRIRKIAARIRQALLVADIKDESITSHMKGPRDIIGSDELRTHFWKEMDREQNQDDLEILYLVHFAVRSTS